MCETHNVHSLLEIGAESIRSNGLSPEAEFMRIPHDFERDSQMFSPCHLAEPS